MPQHSTHDKFPLSESSSDSESILSEPRQQRWPPQSMPTNLLKFQKEKSRQQQLSDNMQMSVYGTGIYFKVEKMIVCL